MTAAEKKRHIIVFACITALCLIGDSMLYVVLPVHYKEAGLASLWEVGVVLSVNRIVRLPLNPCIGWFYTVVSERTGILIAVVLATVTTFSYGFLPNFAFWVLARCVWGLAWTLLRLGSLFCILKLATPENRGRYTGLYNGLFRLGSLVGMLFGGLLADAAGIGITAVIFGMITASSVALALFLIPKGAEQQEECPAATSIRASLSLALKDWKVFWVVAAGGLVAFVFQGAVASTLSRLITVHTAGGVTLFGALVGASTLAGLFQALRWGWEPWLAPAVGAFSDRPGGRSRMLLHSFALGAVVLALLAAPLPLSLWFVCLLAMQVAATALTTVCDAAGSDAAAMAGGRTLLMGYALVVDVGAALGPLVAYSMNEFFGINAVYLFSAALLVLLFVKWRPYAAAGASSPKE